MTISFPWGSSQPRDQGLNPVSWGFCTGRWILYHRATWEARSPLHLSKAEGQLTLLFPNISLFQLGTEVDFLPLTQLTAGLKLESWSPDLCWNTLPVMLSCRERHGCWLCLFQSALAGIALCFCKCISRKAWHVQIHLKMSPRTRIS